ncbi:MAG TPA: hypothetical protein VMK84_07230 [Streptosporangiaceae bacterium]|nr:hypothetical protein [Streptosporangiaceae bacterium]
MAALQDPRKDVQAIRNLFPDRIAMRLDEPEQTDMVLGDGAQDRGAACKLISSDPATGAGVAFIRVEADPDPVRVRAGWVTDADIRAMADQCVPELARVAGGMTAVTAWRTDEPCPVCATGLILLDDGTSSPRYECRLRGWSDICGRRSAGRAGTSRTNPP